MKFSRLCFILSLALLWASAAQALDESSSLLAVQPVSRSELWNARDLAGWVLYLKPPSAAPAAEYKVDQGVLSFPTGKLGYLRTEKSYKNFHLHVEWRWPDGTGNSGVFVYQKGPDLLWPYSIQVNLKAGAAGELLAQDTMKFPDGSKKIPVAASAERSGREWNSCDIFCCDAALEARVNGVSETKVDHLPTAEGQIALQLEKAAVDFRNIWIEPLPAESSK